MKLESLLSRLEQIKTAEENGQFFDLSEGYVEKLIIQALLDYLGNAKIEEAVNEIPF